MAFEFLKDLFGKNEDGTPKALTADELEQAITANKDLKVVNLASGEYVSQEKYARLETRANGLQASLDEANTKLKSFEKDGVTIEDVRKEAADWKTKYETDTKALNDKLAAQERSHLIDQYLASTQFTSSLARQGIKTMLEGAAELSVKDGALVGADDLMKGYKSQFADAFKPEEDPKGDDNPPSNLPRFISTNPMNSTGPNPKKGKGMTLAEAMVYKNEHPDADVKALIGGNQ